MKISKLILACLVGGIVGNTFAIPVKLSCEFTGVEYYDGTRRLLDGKEYVVLGFDDSQSDSVEIATDTLTGSNYNINKPEDIEILLAMISWSYYSAGERKVTYKINRRDGAIVGSVHN